MAIQLSDHFNYKRLLKFVFPSIIMMVFTSVYGVVDGLFVSNYVGKTAFATINLILRLDLCLEQAAAPWWQRRLGNRTLTGPIVIFP